MTVLKPQVAPIKATSTTSCTRDNITSIPVHTYTGPVLSSTQLFLRVAFLGLAFSLIFSGYHVAQSFVTTIYGSNGFIVLCIIYTTFAISSLFAPFMNNLLEGTAGSGRGETLTMVLSGFGYVIFIVTVATGSTAALFAGGFVKGVASGLLWISQGIWLTKIVTAYTRHHQNERDSENIVGIATGVFFTLFNLNSIIGNVVVIILFKAGATIKTMILTMAGVVAVGAILVIFSPKLPAVTAEPAIEMMAVEDVTVQDDNVKQQGQKANSGTVMGRLSAIGRLASKPKTFYLTPYLMCQGVNLAYTFGSYPTFIEHATKTAVLPEGTDIEIAIALNIAYCFLAYGVGSMIGSYCWGKVYDWFNSRLYPLLISHFFLVVCTFTLLMTTILANVPYPTSIFPCLVIVGFMFGTIDFLTNAIINNSITRNYDGEEVSLAFSWYRFCYCIGFALAAAIGAAIPGIQSPGSGWVIMIIINLIFMVVSVISGFTLEYHADKNFRSRRKSKIPVVMH